MTTPINKELRELRMAKEHYIHILKNDEFYKFNKISDGVRLLSDEDIVRINKKIDALDGKIVELLDCVKDLEF